MSVDGSWKVTMTTPRGAQEATLELKTQGGALSGTWSGAQGAREFSGGTIEGNSLTWEVQMSGPMGAMALRFTGTVEGDKISGNVQLGNFGNGSFSGARS